MSDPQGQSSPGQETPGPDAKAADLPVPGATPAVSAAASSAAPDDPGYADRVYRSLPTMFGGGLVLAITLWLTIDALVSGSGRTTWIALAVLVLLVPLVGGYTFWPRVSANDNRLRVRNPLRTITVPWSSFESIEAALSVELHAGGKKYQVWAVPVSLRQRKRANRRMMITKGDQAVQASSRRGRADVDPRHPVGGPGLRSNFGRGGAGGASASGDGYGSAAPNRAWADQVVAEIRELAERGQNRPGAKGEVDVSWTWWIIAPALLGAVALLALVAAG